MADVVDVMFGWFVDLIGWLFEKILQLIGWLIKMLFGGIKALWNLIFRRKEPQNSTTSVQQPSTQGSSNASSAEAANENNDSLMKSYEDIVADIQSVEGLDAEESKKALYHSIMTILIHKTLPIRKKGELIELADKKVHAILPETIDYANFYVKIVGTSYTVLNEMTEGFFTNDINRFKAAIARENKEAALKPLTDYLTDIMAAIAAMNAPDGQFSFEPSMIEGITLPEWGIKVA